MDEIIKGLYLGDIEDAINAPEDFVIVNVAGTRSYKGWSKEKARKLFSHQTYVIPLYHDNGNSEIYDIPNYYMVVVAVDMIATLLKTLGEKNVLVHCWHGIDRSPFVVATYLKIHEDMESGEAYGLIKQKRPMIAEHYEWWD